MCISVRVSLFSLRSLRFGAKKDQGTGFSVLAAREIKQEPKNESTYVIFERSLTIVPRSLLLNRTETLTTQAALC